MRFDQKNWIHRCEHNMKELDYYRNQHIAAMSQSESGNVQDSAALRGKYGDLVNEKSLQKDQEVLVNDPSSNAADAMNQHYMSALRKYEAIKDEYDALRKRYDDLISSHSSTVNKVSQFLRPLVSLITAPGFLWKTFFF